jgi:hypothetical protein
MTFAKAVFIVAGRFLTLALYRVVRLQDGSKILDYCCRAWTNCSSSASLTSDTAQ